MAQADGSVIIDTKMNNNALEKGFERLKTDAESLGITCEKAGDKIKAAFADYDVSANIQNAVAKLEQAQIKLQTATDYFNDAVAMGDDKSAEAWARKREVAYTQVENAQRRLTQVIAAEANKQAAEEEKAQVKATKAAERAAAAEERAQIKATKAAEREAAKKKKAQEKAYKDATKGARRFATRFSSILSGALVFNALSAGLRQLTSYFGTALKKNSEFASSFAQLKGAFLTAVQPIYEVVSPALIYLMNLLTRVMQAISQVFSLLTGKSTSQMAQNAKNLYEQANATEAAGAAAEKAKKQLMGFDEINRLDDSGSSGGGTSGGGTAPNFGETETATAGVITTILDSLRAKLTEYADLFQPTIDAWSKAFEGFPESVSPAIETIKTSFTKLLSETLQPFSAYLLENFIPSISNSFSENLAPVFSDVLSTAIQGFAIDFENATLVIDECLSWVQTGLEQVKTIFTDMCTSINEKWNKYGGSIMASILKFKAGLWETFWGIYDQIVKPVLDNCAQMFSWLWDEHLKPLWDNIVEFVMSLMDNILALWNGFLKPVVDWMIAYFAPIITNAINAIWNAVSKAAAYISDIIGAVLKVLDGLITFIVGVFTRDFERAWNGIKKIFGGTWDGMVAGAKGAINVVIWAINRMISGIYAGIASVVNGMGSVVKTVGKVFGQNWGFSVPTAAPKIPYLAKGAVLPANKPFLAMVGDQKHGTNVEAPLSTIQEAVALVMEDMTGGMMAGFEATVAVLREILEAIYGIEIGDEVIAKAAQRYQAKMAVVKRGG